MAEINEADSGQIYMLEKAAKILRGAICGAGIALAISPKMRTVIKTATINQLDQEHEEIEALALGITVEKYRLIKSFPGGWIDWSEIGKR